MNIYTKVDKDTCLACGACQSLEPDVFISDEEGMSHTKHDDNTGSIPLPKELHESLAEAIKFCATDSIKVSYKPFPKKD